jgi:hypothetical protein
MKGGWCRRGVGGCGAAALGVESEVEVAAAGMARLAVAVVEVARWRR